MKKLILTAASFCLMAGVAVLAQNGGGPANPQGGQMNQAPEAGEQLSSEERATRITDEMSTVLGLSDKQYKKVYKFNVKDQEQQAELLGGRMGGPGGGPGMGPGGMPGGMGGPGGGRPGGMGGPGGGMPGGAGGGRPGGAGGGMPGGGPGMGPDGGMPGGAPDLSELEAYWTKKEKKLRKLLTDEQFDKWYGLHPEHFGVRKNPDDKMPFDGVKPENAPKQ